MAGKAMFTVEEMAKALTESRGFKTVAARRLGCDWHTVDNYCKKHPELDDVLQQAHESALDQAEVALHSLISPPRDAEGNYKWPPNLGAICFFLKCQGKSRGYIERVEHDLRGDMTYSIKLPDDWPAEDYDDPDINPDSPTKPPQNTNGHFADCDSSV